MNELNNFTASKLYEKLALADVEFDAWLTRIGLLHARRSCPQCDGEMGRRQPQRNERYGIWKCKNAQCRRPSVAFLVGTFFGGSHLTTKQIFCLSYFWAQEMGNQSQLMREVGIGSARTVVDWRNFCRDVCAEHFINHARRIGGPGIVVEIDETLAVRRKYERGRLVVNDVWIFGGVERGNPQQCFMVPVERRNAATLLPLIVDNILPGSIIHSDMWAAYGGIPALPGGYMHETVNHTTHFVNPITGAHTQSVESMWQKLKNKAKRRFGDSRALYDTYIAEHLWRKQFGDFDSVFFNFWTQAAELYPCEH